MSGFNPSTSTRKSQKYTYSVPKNPLLPFSYERVEPKKPNPLDTPPGRIWNVKSRKYAQVVLFVLGMVVFILGIWIK